MQTAQARGQSLAQMALAGVPKDKRITSVLIGASSVSQIDDNFEMLRKMDFSSEELQQNRAVLNN